LLATSDKGLITRICRELEKLNSQKINDPKKKWANEVQIAKKHMKKCSTSLAIKEIQIKTTLRFCLTPVRMNTNTNDGEVVGKRNPSHIFGGIVN
jgi:hypothetical protein